MHQLQLPLRQPSPDSVARAFSEIHLVPLPPRRRQVLALYLSGQSRKQVAERLGVSPYTIRNHIRLVYDQFGLSNRIHALRWALGQPALARQILALNSWGGQNTETGIRQDIQTKSTSIETAVAEAIAFFQREVIDSSMESL